MRLPSLPGLAMRHADTAGYVCRPLPRQRVWMAPTRDVVSDQMATAAEIFAEMIMPC